jgi:predicted MFS family arabinose efflux permease
MRATAYSGFAIWGSIGWATATALAGVAVWVFGIKAAFYFATMLFLVAMIVSLRITEPRGIQGVFPKTPACAPVRPRITKSYFAPIRELVTNKKMILLLLASLPLILAMNAAHQFFPIYLESSGGSSILIGLVFAVSAILEIPVFLRVGKLSDRIGSRKPLLIFSAAIYSLLFLLFVLTSNPFLLFVIYSLLAPLAWPPLITGSSTLISEIVPPDKWVTGQTLYTIWMWSIGGIIGPLIGGFTSDAWGLPVMFAVASVLAAVSMIFFRGVREK